MNNIIALPYDAEKQEITINFRIEFVQTDLPMIATFVYDTERSKYYTMDSVLFDEVKNNIQRYIMYRPKVAIKTSAAFNFSEFIDSHVQSLNMTKADVMPVLVAEAEIILTLSEYNDYVENDYLLINDIFKLKNQEGGGDNAER